MATDEQFKPKINLDLLNELNAVLRRYGMPTRDLQQAFDIVATTLLLAAVAFESNVEGPEKASEFASLAAQIFAHAEREHFRLTSS